MADTETRNGGPSLEDAPTRSVLPRLALSGNTVERRGMQPPAVRSIWLQVRDAGVRTPVAAREKAAAVGAKPDGDTVASERLLE